MDDNSSTLLRQRPKPPPTAANQIQPTFTSPASANPSTAVNEQQPDNARVEQSLSQVTTLPNTPTFGQLLDDAELDWDQRFSEEPLTEQRFFSQFLSKAFFPQYNRLQATVAANPIMAADQMPTNLATSQLTIAYSPMELQYPLGDNMAASNSQGSNCTVFSNHTMEQASHERHAFEGDGDWDEFVDTAKRANNWGSDDPHLEVLWGFEYWSQEMLALASNT